MSVNREAGIGIEGKERTESRIARLLPLIGKASKLTKLVKSVKVLKILLTFGTAMASVFAYSFLLGVWFSVGLVGMLFVHEMGHVIALRRKGMKASMPVFIPFLGAAIFAPSFGDREDEAYMAIAGPIVGGLGGLIMLAVVVAWGSPSELVALIAYTALWLNVFNLIPISPLDGGRVTQAIGPWFKYIGIAILVIGTVALRATGLLLIWILIIGELGLNRAQRVVACVSVWTAMTMMETLDVGQHQWFWWNVYDMVIGALFCLMYGTKFYDTSRPKEPRPQLSRGRKWFWTAVYLIVAAVLIAGMLVAGHYIPPKATR